MSNLTSRASAIDDLPDMWDGFMRMVRPGLGISAFGANIMNLPPDYTTRSHDESASGQEELYVRLAGSGWIVLDDSGERLENRRYTSSVKTFFRRLEAAVASGDDEAAAAEHRTLVRTIDKAVKRGALHRNTGARKKSRAARLLRGQPPA